MPIPLLLAIAVAAAPPPDPVPLRSGFLFALSTPTGAAESTWGALAYDEEHDEILVAHYGLVRVFNASGMQTHAFGGDEDLSLTRVAVLGDGDIVAIGYAAGQPGRLHRCNFRGERVGRFELRDLPASFSDFEPDAIVHRRGNLYFAERAGMRVVVADERGRVHASHDVAKLLKLDGKGRAEGGVTGFGVGADGSLLFTIPTLFTAYVVSPAGEVRSFGTRGSTPGKFNNVGGITSDERGAIFVTDRLRSVVMAFDRELTFRGEFGYRGDEEGNLVAPFELVVGRGQIFVSQAGNRGVSVFSYELE